MNPPEKPVTNLAAYRFVSLDRLSWRRKRLLALGKELDLRGTILLSPEGINLFLAGPDASVRAMLEHLRQDPPLAELETKFSYSDHVPFRRLLVKIKREIIASNGKGIDPIGAPTPKLPPSTLRDWLDAQHPVTLLDVRNDYEVKLGRFAHARTIGISHFRQFAQAADRLPDELKRQPIVMYCTGGIRCEKAGPLLQQMGFEHVYQLDGGILRYFEECGGTHFEGECFVFDQRVALDSTLSETATTLCFLCQMPVTQAEQQSPHFVPGRCCPACYRSPQETAAETIARRHVRLRQIVTPLPGSMPYENRRPLRVPPRADGGTLLALLTTTFPYIALQDWLDQIANGRLQRNGQVLGAEDVVRAGERIEHVEPATVEPDVAIDIQILHEDELLVVVNKPAPLPMHPCGRFNRNTLISILEQVYHPHRLRAAHRLDANTTGVAVLTRSRAIAGLVQPQFERGEVEKRYLALVEGSPDGDEFCCEAPITETGRRGGRREVVSDGLPSRTDFRVLERRSDGTTLVEARPRTGRTNQIRLHLAHLGWPIRGDRMYGAACTSDDTLLQTLDPSDPPLCLHAWQITLRHPLDGKPVQYTAPAPAWLRTLDAQD